MNTESFYELRRRLYLAAAAGCSCINEDHLLKNALKNFMPLAKMNKTFTKLAEMCESIFSADMPVMKLAECIAFADAATLAQGDFSDNSVTEKQEYHCEFSVNGSIPYSEISEYTEYVNGGRSPQIHYDFRVLSAFVRQHILSYKKNARDRSIEFVITEFYGKSILPLYFELIDLTDRREKGEIFSFLKKFGGSSASGYFISAAENENISPKIRAAAVRALSCDPVNTEKLLGFYLTGKGNIKKSALAALGELAAPEADKYFRKMAEDYKDAYEEYFVCAKNKICANYIRDNFDAAFYDYKNSNDSVKSRRIFSLLNMMKNKKDIDEIYIKLINSDKNWAQKLNEILVCNISENTEHEYKDMITRLFKKNKLFLPAALYLSLSEDPENTYRNFYDILSENIEEGIKPFDMLYYIEVSEKYLSRYAVRDFHTYSGEMLLTRDIPQIMLDWLTDTRVLDDIGRKNNISGVYCSVEMRCSALSYLFDFCSESDRERIKNAAVKFAFNLCKKCPCPSAIRVISEYHESIGKVFFLEIIPRYTAFLLDNIDEASREKADRYGVGSVDFDRLINDLPLKKREKEIVLDQTKRTAASHRDNADKALFMRADTRLKNVILTGEN